MKRLFKENSLYLIFLALAETVLSVIATLSFVYTDSLTYSKSLVIQMLGIEKLLEAMYTSTWWALVLLLLFFVALFSIMTLLYKDLKYMVISIGCTIELFLLSINFTKPIKEIILNIILFIPIFVLNIIVYKNESKKINEQSKKKTKKTSK